MGTTGITHWIRVLTVQAQGPELKWPALHTKTDVTVFACSTSSVEGIDRNPWSLLLASQVPVRDPVLQG